MSLKGIRILDLTRLIPGPFCTQMLGDLGAEVVKIEDPFQGDSTRWKDITDSKGKGMNPDFLGLNRNKKSLTLNLKTREGMTIFRKLVMISDVIAESFRPGVVDHLGIGYERMKRLNRRLIYCSISSYGQDGPYKNKAGHDINSLAITGILDITGRRRGPPIIPGVQIADFSAGMWAAFAIVVALLARNKDNEGQYIDISMTDGVLSWLPLYAARYFAEKSSPRRGETMLNGQLACYNIYKTKDGKFMALGAVEPQFWERTCQVLGKERLIKDQFNLSIQRKIIAEIGKVFLEKTRQEWVKFFEDENVCCEAVRNMEEAFLHP